MRRFLVYLLFSLLFLPAFAQEKNDTIVPLPSRPWLAAGEVFAFNVGGWAFDRYVIDGDYAYISLNSMERNLRKGFYWDNDNFMTNLFNHPYHGSLVSIR